jgi:hypothetical protein
VTQHEMIEGLPVMTREEFLDRYTYDEKGAALHRQYYSQFVDNHVRAVVRSTIGVAQILASSDPKNFNDIPIKQWDAVTHTLGAAAAKMRKLGDYLTPSGAVCIAKEAALQILEREQAKKSEA